MNGLELVLVLLGAAAALEVLAHRAGIPHPALLVLGGLVLAVTPGLPRVEMDPETVFLIFVPPLLYRAALTTSWRDFRRNMPTILSLAIGLVLGTIAAVAVVIHALSDEFPWSSAFVLGAIVAPPDAVAALAVMRRLGVPRRIVTILEGEGLVNDATALVAYRMAIAASVAGTFSFGEAALRFLAAAGGGVALGLTVGWAIGWIRRMLGRASLVENTISILTPFAAYIPADRLGVSGVLSVVAVGLYLGRRGPRIVSPATRVQAIAMWDMIVFLLEGLVFILIGLYLPTSVKALEHYSIGVLAWYAAITSLVVIGVRLVGAFPLAVVNHLLARFGSRCPAPPWKGVAFIGWAGMRGGDSLVIALALPFSTSSGAPFPARELIVFITFWVILVTLVLQGFTFAPSIRLLGLRDDGEEESEHGLARRAATEAGLARLEEIAKDPEVPAELVVDLRELHARKLEVTREGHPTEKHRRWDAYRHVRLEMIRAERGAIIKLRDEGHISDSVLWAVQRDLDFEVILIESDDSRHKGAHLGEKA